MAIVPQIPQDTSCEAEYEDGFVLSETEHNDMSAYVEMEIVNGAPSGPNIFNDILERRPEPVHGKMVRFSVYYNGRRHDFDWTQLPENARPIRFRDGFSGINKQGEIVRGYSGVRFGFQYNDENGNNRQHIEELH